MLLCKDTFCVHFGRTNKNRMRKWTRISNNSILKQPDCSGGIQRCTSVHCALEKTFSSRAKSRRMGPADTHWMSNPAPQQQQWQQQQPPRLSWIHLSLSRAWRSLPIRGRRADAQRGANAQHRTSDIWAAEPRYGRKPGSWNREAAVFTRRWVAGDTKHLLQK